MQSGTAQIADEILILLDFLIAAGEIEGHFLHVVDIAVADVPDPQTGGLHFVLEPDEIFVVRFVAAGRDIHIPAAELIDELQIFIGRIGGHLHRDLDARRPGSGSAPPLGLRCRHGGKSGAQDRFAEFPAFNGSFHTAKYILAWGKPPLRSSGSRHVR